MDRNNKLIRKVEINRRMWDEGKEILRGGEGETPTRWREKVSRVTISFNNSIYELM